MNYDAILFDFDGVLMDSEPVHYECWKEVLAPMGIRIDWESYCSHCVGASSRRRWTTIRGWATLPSIPMKFGHTIRRSSGSSARTWSASCLLCRASASFCVARWPFQARGGQFQFALGAGPVAAQGGILDCFAALVFGEDVERHKPAPDPYLLRPQTNSGRAKPRWWWRTPMPACSESAHRAGMDAVRIRGGPPAPSKWCGRRSPGRLSSVA